MIFWNGEKLRFWIFLKKYHFLLIYIVVALLEKKKSMFIVKTMQKVLVFIY